MPKCAKMCVIYCSIIPDKAFTLREPYRPLCPASPIMIYAIMAIWR